MPHLSEIQVLRFLIQFTVLFVVARLLADIMKRIGQATVIGELLSGIVIGPSLLGHLAPAAYRLLFPADPMSDHLLEAVAWLGVILLLLYTGLETDLAILRGVGKAAVGVSSLGILIPWLSGFALGWEVPASYLAVHNDRLIFALFLAIAMSISAVPVIAKILIDLNLMRRDLGLLILGAGILDDTAGWLMLSIVAGLAAHGMIDVRSLASILIAVACFIGFCYLAGATLVIRMMRWVDDRGVAEHAGMSAMVGIAMVCAIVTQAIGVHAVFGAYIAGVMIGRSARLRRSNRTELEAITIGVFAPVFFAYSGLKVDLMALHGVGMLGIVLGVAIVGKLLGCTVGGLLSGLKAREALAIGVGMNARGGMGIIVGLLGLSLGVLSREMYAIIILVAIVTSMMTPPLITWLLGGVAQRPSEAERLERERILARLPFTKEGAKLLVLAGGGPHAQLAGHLAAALGNHQDASLTVFHATTDEHETADSAAQSDRYFATIKALAELSGARNVYRRSASDSSISDALTKEVERGYDAIFAGASPAGGEYAVGGEVLYELVSKAQAPVIIVRNVGAPMPLRRVLVPITGAAFSRLGATVALLYAQAVGAHLTALYVKEIPLLSWRKLRRVNRLDEGPRITGDIKTMGEQFGVPIMAEIASGSRPENSIMAAAERGCFDLLVMGVQLRPAGQVLYFGPKVEHILRNARCAVALVVMPEIPAAARA